MIKLIYLLVAILLLNACKKSFLDTKPDQSLLIPKTLADFQALLDNNGVMNKSPAFGLIASDEYAVDNAKIAALSSQLEARVYLWDKNPFEGASVSDWNVPYEQVFYANVVLDGLNSMNNPGVGVVYNSIKGSALFYRAMAFYQLAQLFCLPYKPGLANNDPGIILRLQSDVQLKSNRATVKEAYDQIILDLQSALTLLPKVSQVKTRPDQQAVYALLARVYLLMGDYQNALASATECLKGSSGLLDYNNLNPVGNSPFPPSLPAAGGKGNQEVIFYSSAIAYSFVNVNSNVVSVNQEFYQLFDDNDLRKVLFFRNSGEVINFKGSYGASSSSVLFSGLALDEVYLIRAEAHVRLGNDKLALDDLNLLLRNRMDSSIFVDLIVEDPNELLSLILLERRKQLLFRSARWSDLRRLNFENGYQTTLKRMDGSDAIPLAPNDLRYVFPIPQDEINATGIPQNPR